MAEYFFLNDVTTAFDLSPYVVSMDWSGSLDQAGRKLNFVIAYTKKDMSWTNANVNLGDDVELVTQDDTGNYKIFAGKIFMQSRNSESYTMEFVAYDHLIYLSKSHINAKFTDITIRDCITQICQLVGISVGDLSCEDLNQKVNFVADDMAGSEAISKALETATAWTGWTYHIYMSIDKSGKQVLNVVRANTVIDSLVLTDTKDIMTAAHSASLEDMVNRVAIADKDGNITGYLTMDDDAKKYGMIQGIYRVQDKQDTQTYAKKMLHGVTENSQLTALGNIQCISGYAVMIQEEQIQGKFLIIADSHNIAGNVHKMNLTLRYITEPEKKATYTGGVNE